MDTQPARVLIVDDDPDIGMLLSALMKEVGFISSVAHDGETALQMVPQERPDMLLVDVQMPGIDGMEVLRRVKEMDPHLPVVLITAYAKIPASVAAMRAGAFDYLAKPFNHTEVVRVVRAALAERERRRRSQTEESSADNCLRVMMGPSDAVTRIIREVNRVAPSDFSVIIQGETGSGKELVARAIYQLSHRASAPFIPLDCGAIPESLIESELFGYQKGAFTGAAAPKAGLYFWTKLPICPWGPRRGCCGSCRRKRSCAWGPPSPSRLMCACSPPATRNSKDWWHRDRCGRISIFA
jgi:two-component system nitrogen regulation response regulator GlnG